MADLVSDNAIFSMQLLRNYKMSTVQTWRALAFLYENDVRVFYIGLIDLPSTH